MTILENLRKYQIKMSLTSYELAMLLAVDIDKLANWYRGEDHLEEVDRYKIIKLIDGEDLDELVDGEFVNYRMNN